MTIDQGADTSRYQGLVALEGGSLEDAAHEYFLRSEQIPTRVRLAVAEELRAGEGGAEPSLARRRHPVAIFAEVAGARARRRSRSRRCAGRHRCRTRSPEDDAWVEGRALVETVEDVELIDPALSSERLVYRLFHEPGVRVFRGRDVRARMLVLARQCRGHAARAFRRTTATTWSRTARFPSPANSAARITMFAPGEVERKSQVRAGSLCARRFWLFIAVDRAAGGVGAKLSGAARFGAPAGAGHRRLRSKSTTASVRTFRAHVAEGAVAGRAAVRPPR